ncbi:response regulator [Paenibacillus macerans]|uniref:response regulator transcription factor n=1 Tax=Paenibacillus macerans TaxID=44252 RepID=UPI00203BA81E|nr:response regulator [Paenibacillus macerans]MCM3699955.1 response regulator [Paenibacillus macerans]
MRILVVDDEARHRRGMFHLLRSIRPDYEVAVAKNGLEALEAIRLQETDIVLTDIRMPGMDGLAFLENLSDIAKRPKVIILSAYNLFEYAQTALRHGANDYLLKPVDTDKVEEVLLRLEAQMALETRKDTETEKEQILMDWLKGTLEPEIFRNSDAEVAEMADQSGLVAVTEYLPEDHVPSREDEKRLCDDLQDAWSAFGLARSFIVKEAGEERIIAVTIIRCGGTETIHAQKSEARLALEKLSHHFRYAGGRLEHAAGHFCKRLLNEGPSSYRASLAALRFAFYDKWNGIVIPEERATGAVSPFELDHERLYAALCGQQAKHALVLCRSAFDRLAGEGWTEPAVVKDSAALTLMLLKSRCRELLDRDTSGRLSEAATKEIPACETYYALLSILEARLLEVHRVLQGKKRGRGEYVAEACIRIIRSRYMEDLTLENVAEQFYFNPSYFSTMFKSHTGRTFSEYLTDTRITRAKELLSDPACTLKIYDVAEQSGYRDTKYFSRIFKRTVGVSPEAYRHKSLENLRQ